jgi:pSer/pThr/pTyr-binding forkhead associated (FHA) protein
MWPIDNNELIDILSNPYNKQTLEITYPVKLYRDDEEIKIEKIKDNDNNSKEKITDDEDVIKLGEILIKDSKYYYKPNTKESYYPNLNDTNNTTNNNNTEFHSWLIYKGNKIPVNKNKYRIKEGDILKIGREWLFIKDIYISKRTKKLLKIKCKEKNKGNNKLFSYHSQTNKELNINEDFNVMEFNDTDEDKDEEIKGEKNKFITENEESKKHLKHIIVKDKESSEKNSNHYNDNNKNKRVKICRICYLEEYDKYNNPLIKPCKCSGSMKYIHYECLLHWIKTKISVESSSYSSNELLSVYTLSPLECELCKTKLPNYLRHKKEIYSLLNLDKKFNEEINLNKKGEKISKKRRENKDSYIIFDSISPQRIESRFRFFVKFNENNILKIGRGLDMQLVLNDISVSRNHCQLKIEDDGSIVLEDNNSKFGSLVLIQKEIEILKGNCLNIQVGTNYFTFTLKKKTGFFSCCNAEEIDSKNNYENLNSMSIKYDKKKEILDESITIEENEEDNEQIIQKQKEDNEKIIIDDEKGEDNKENDLIIFDQTKRIRNKRNKDNNNNNFESTCNGSTLVLKENQTQDRLNMVSNSLSNNNTTNMKTVRKELNEVNKDELDGIKSENIIISEGEESKSKKEIEINANIVAEN